jgi:hypothetical protein
MRGSERADARTARARAGRYDPCHRSRITDLMDALGVGCFQPGAATGGVVVPPSAKEMRMIITRHTRAPTNANGEPELVSGALRICHQATPHMRPLRGPQRTRLLWYFTYDDDTSLGGQKLMHSDGAQTSNALNPHPLEPQLPLVSAPRSRLRLSARPAIT